MRSLKSGFARAARQLDLTFVARSIRQTAQEVRDGADLWQYDREIRNHLDKNFPYIVVIFDTTGNLAAEIPARNLAEAALTSTHGWPTLSGWCAVPANRGRTKWAICSQQAELQT